MGKRQVSELVVCLSIAVLVVLLGYPCGARADRLAVLVTPQGRRIYINTGRSQPLSSSGAFSSRSLSPAISDVVNDTAQRFQLDPDLVNAVIQVESDYDPRAVSRKGAMGLMQLIPATARRFGVQNPFDPKQNVEGGVTYLNYLLNLFQGDLPLSLAAYNAGENSVLRAHGIPPFRETRRYVEKVTSLYRGGGNWHPTAKGPRMRMTPVKKQPARTGVTTAGPVQTRVSAPIYSYVDASGVVHFAQ